MTTTSTPVLATGRWIPDGPLRGAAVVLAGRGESPEVYGRLGRRLAADGYALLAVAWAAAPSGAVVDAVRLALEADDVIVSARAASLPVIAIGADDGAVLALRAAEAIELRGLVLAGIATEAAADELSWDAELDARTACPVHRGVLDGAAVLRRGALSEAPRIGLPAELPVLPILLVHGENDVITPLRTARELARATVDSRLAVVRGGRHDILNDVQHRSIAAWIVLFLESLRSGGATIVEILPSTELLP
jgi:alpha-beta hydrolase superfamily lysophospholipase